FMYVHYRGKTHVTSLKNTLLWGAIGGALTGGIIFALWKVAALVTVINPVAGGIMLGVAGFSALGFYVWSKTRKLVDANMGTASKFSTLAWQFFANPMILFSAIPFVLGIIGTIPPVAVAALIAAIIFLFRKQATTLFMYKYRLRKILIQEEIAKLEILKKSSDKIKIIERIERLGTCLPIIERLKKIYTGEGLESKEEAELKEEINSILNGAKQKYLITFFGKSLHSIQSNEILISSIDEIGYAIDEYNAYEGEMKTAYKRNIYKLMIKLDFEPAKKELLKLFNGGTYKEQRENIIEKTKNYKPYKTARQKEKELNKLNVKFVSDEEFEVLKNGDKKTKEKLIKKLGLDKIDKVVPFSTLITGMREKRNEQQLRAQASLVYNDGIDGALSKIGAFFKKIFGRALSSKKVFTFVTGGFSVVSSALMTSCKMNSSETIVQTETAVSEIADTLKAQGLLTDEEEEALREDARKQGLWTAVAKHITKIEEEKTGETGTVKKEEGQIIIESNLPQLQPEKSMDDEIASRPKITQEQKESVPEVHARRQPVKQKSKVQTPDLAEEARMRKITQETKSSTSNILNPFFAIDESYTKVFGNSASDALSDLLRSMGTRNQNLQKFLAENPEVTAAGAFVEAYINQQNSEGLMTESFEKFQKFNDSFGKLRRIAETADQFNRQAPLDFSRLDFNAADALEIMPMLSITILLNDALMYCEQVNANSARVEFENMRQMITDKEHGDMKVNDPRQAKFAYFDAADLNKPDRPALRNFLAQNNNNAKMAFDGIMFDFIFTSLPGLPANYVMSDDLRQAILSSRSFNNSEVFAVKNDNGEITEYDLRAWEENIIYTFGAYVYTDAFSQTDKNLTTAQDWVNFGKILMEVPSQYANVMSNSDIIINANADGNFRGNAKAAADAGVPVFSPLFAPGQIGREFSQSLKKISGSGFSKDAVEEMRRGREQFYLKLNEIKNDKLKAGESIDVLTEDDVKILGISRLHDSDSADAVMSGVELSIAGAAFDFYAMKEYGITALSKNLRDALVSRYISDGSSDLQKFIQDNETVIAVEGLRQKTDVKPKKQDYNYFKEIKALREKAAGRPSWFHSDNQVNDILAKADDFLESEGKKEVEELKKLIGDLPRGLKNKIDKNDSEFLGALRENNYDARKVFYSIISENFFIEPMLSSDGRTLGWRWGNISDGKSASWGKKPKSGEPYFSRWNAAKNGKKTLTIDFLISEIEKSPEFANESVPLSKTDWFDIKLAFMSSSHPDFRSRLLALINAYRQARLNARLKDALVKRDYKKINELLFQTKLIEKVSAGNAALNLIDKIVNENMEESAMSDGALIDFITETMKPGLYLRYKGLSDGLKNAVIESHKKTGDVNQTLESFRNDIVFEAWKDYINESNPGALEVLAPLGALFLPKGSNYVNDNLTNLIPSAGLAQNLSVSLSA
ncbi:MAG: hypothetical protein LBU09_02535, partial [Endomicrobium sp.]|nr:hypothetical protein [Endomicrobium sp.]